MLVQLIVDTQYVLYKLHRFKIRRFKTAEKSFEWNLSVWNKILMSKIM